MRGTATARRPRTGVAALLPLVVGLALALPLLLLPSVIGAPAARAITPGASVNVVIDDLAPLAPMASSTLRLSGRVANAAPVELAGVRVRLRVATTPITDRAEIARIATAPLVDASDGTALGVTAPITATLAPGGEGAFRLSVPMARLGLRAPGAYPLAVEALAADGTRLGITRTFVPWLPEGAAAPLGVAWLWPLAAAPARTATGAFLDDDIPQSLAADGRLGRLVSLGTDAPVTWVADPALLQAAAAIGDGYQIERDGTLVVGDAGTNGPAWLASLARAIGPRGLHPLPYADIDATASRRAGLGTDVTQAITLGPVVGAASLPPGTAIGSSLAWMPAIDRQTSNLLVTSGVRTVVLRESSLQPDSAALTGVGTLGTIAGPLTAVTADDALSDLMSVPTPTTAEALLVRQQALAHLGVLAAGATAESPRRVVIAPPALWDPSARVAGPLLRATRTAPWLQPITLDGLLDGPRSPRQREPYGPEAKSAELTPQALAAVAREQDRLGALAAILDDPSQVVEPFGQALLRAQSRAWRVEPRTGASLVTSIRRELVARTDAVHVLSRGSIVFSGDVGAVPVTIENDLDSAVTVGVQLVGEPAARLSSAPLEGIRIEAGQRVSVDLDARVIGGDPLDARVQLLTPEGERYGTPSRVTLSSTAYARAASWVVIAAFLAIAVFVVVGIVRRIRKAGAER